MLPFDILAYRLSHGRQTMAYPKGPAPALPDRHGGSLRVDGAKCADGCAECVAVCPSQAIALRSEARKASVGGRGITLDLGRCLFCAECVTACPTGAITQTGDHRMAASRREDLVLGEPGQEEVRLASALDEKLRRLFGRSLRLRQVSAGGCGGAEAELNGLTTIGWDIGRFGIQLVASPRHADGLVVTGPVPKNMILALRKAWEAMPEPKLVIAAGTEAISGGPFAGNPEVAGGIAGILPVDLFIPGWPPHPLTLLDGLLRLLGRLDEKRFPAKPDGSSESG